MIDSGNVTPPLAYDWRVTAIKGLKHAGLALGGIALYGACDALAASLGNPSVVTGLLGPLAKDHPSILLFVPLIVGAVGAFENWRKNRS